MPLRNIRRHSRAMAMAGARRRARKKSAAGAPALPPLKLSPAWLLALYGILPLCALFLLVDWLAFDLRLSRALPADPHSMQWFNLFFMLPHIFASLFTFFDRDYVLAYRRRLGISLPLILAAAILFPLLFGYGLFMLLIAVYTVYHLMGQQTGIAALLARHKSWRHEAWRWSSFLALGVLYVVIMVGNPGLAQGLRPWIPWILGGFLATAVLVARQSRTGMGTAYIAANSTMIVACYGLYLANLPFFMILVPRFVHDVTAFFFYVTHNTNRNRERPRNLVSRLRLAVDLPESIWTPATGILCTAFVTFVLKEYLVFILSFLALFHYYWEGVMWKHGSPHRQQIYV